MKKIILLLLILSPLSMAAPDPQLYASSVPYWCVYGSWKEGSVGVGSSSGLDGDYLKIDVREYILINEPIRLKGDGKYLVNKGDTIYFYDSLGGYLGKDDANTDGNAYLTYTPTKQNPFLYQGTIWAMKNLPNVHTGGPVANPDPVSLRPPCSKKDVHFQYRPSLNVVSFNSQARSAVLGYEVDFESKAYRENVPAKISIKWSNAGKTGIAAATTVNNQRGTVQIPNLQLSMDKGIFTLTATIFDGSYESNPITIGEISTPCNTGASTVFQVQPNQPTLNPTNLCGGYHCPYSVTTIPNGPYPKLHYTCK